MPALHQLGAHDLLAAYRSLSLSPVEVLADVLAHIAACEPSLHATYALDATAALASAQASERQRTATASLTSR